MGIFPAGGHHSTNPTNPYLRNPPVVRLHEILICATAVFQHNYVDQGRKAVYNKAQLLHYSIVGELHILEERN